MAEGWAATDWQTFWQHMYFVLAWYWSDGGRNDEGNLLCDGRLTLSNAPEAMHFTVALIEN